MLGMRYEFAAALSLGLRAKNLLYRYWSPPIKQRVICSQVFYDAYGEITQTLLDGCPVDDLVMPAHLSATADLDNIYVPWLSLI
jgi:hypothetical protein